MPRAGKIKITIGAVGSEIKQSRTLAELNGLFNAFVRAYNFTAYAVGFIPGQAVGDDPFLLLDWPRPWLELYAREGFASEDAVIGEAMTASQPFTWSELQRARPGASARIFAAARSFGWNDGFLVPVRIGTGSLSPRIGVASLAAPTLVGFDHEARRIMAEACRLALSRAVELKDSRVPVALSEREREALSFVASGRGDREVGALMGVTAATAHFHVEQAKRKLGAITRAQAVAIAVAQSLIEIP